eukprot:m.196268 g.196268  ORF g.196268 m.196268 type:complete len:815 (+) comp15697_c0_seq4:99-2543(+)
MSSTMDPLIGEDIDYINVVPEGDQSGEQILKDLPDAKRHERIQHAGIYLVEGELYSKFEAHPKNEYSAWLFEFLRGRPWKMLEMLVALLYLFLIVIEKPALWPGVNVYVGLSIEIICLIFFIINLVLHYRLYTSSLDLATLFTSKGFVLRMCIIAILVIDTAVALTTNFWSTRLLRIFRVFLVLDAQYADGVRRVCRQIVQTTWSVSEMLIYVLLYVMVFSLVGFDLFSGIPNDPSFPTFDQSFMSMFILLTTANNPDVMMGVYAKQPLAVIYFALFMLFGFYFFMNLLLGMVIDAYTEFEKTKFQNMFLHKRKALQYAWITLYQEIENKEEAEMDRDTFLEVCKVFRPNATQKQAYLAYRALDTDNNGTISVDEFYEIYDVMDVVYKFSHLNTMGTPGTPPVYHQKFSPGVAKFFKRLQDIAQSTPFNLFVDFVVFANLVVNLVVAIKAKPKEGTADSIADPSNVEDDIFMAIYICEAIFKITALGPYLYFSDRWNKFDFAIIVVSTIAVITELSSVGTASVLVCVVGIRALRLLRLVRIRESFRNIVTGMGHMIPRMGRFFAALGLFFFIFSVIGMYFFNDTVSEKCTWDSTIGANGTGFKCGGGFDRCSDPKPYPDVCIGYYHLNNFNNIFRSFVTLYDLMIVNNWFLIMEGHVVATGTRWARVYFFIFFLVGVNVITNIIVAFVLECFKQLFPILESRRHKKKLEQSKRKQHEEAGEVTEPETENVWSRTYRSKVAIQMKEARQYFDADDDLEMFLNVETLWYVACEDIRAADINRIVFQDEIEDMIEEEKSSNPLSASRDELYQLGLIE